VVGEREKAMRSGGATQRGKRFLARTPTARRPVESAGQSGGLRGGVGWLGGLGRLGRILGKIQMKI
jgi:hypothetical protein